MPYNKDKPKTKKLSFRIDVNGYEFLKDMERLTGIDRSDLIRKIIFLYFMEYFMNPNTNLSKRYEEAKNRFCRLFTDDFIKKVSQ